MAQVNKGDFYIATDGSDRWSGRLSEPNPERTDGPFATLERARMAVREIKAAGLTAPVTVLVRGGVYAFAKPVVFGPEDSGTEVCPITYDAFPGECPVISGGIELSEFQPNTGGLWTLKVPEGMFFSQLFINGERRARARWPLQGCFKIQGGVPTGTETWAASTAGHSPEDLAKRSFKYFPGDFRPEWAEREDIEVVVLQYWMAPRLRIQALDPEIRTVLFTGGSWRPLTWSFGYYLDHVKEGLETPGSWVLERRTGTLWYHPLPGEDAREARAVVPVAEQLALLEGNAAENRWVEHVHFRGLSFQFTSWVLPAEGYAFVQAELPLPAAFQASGARHCRIEQCDFAHLGGWGVELGPGCRDWTVVRSQVRDTGAGSIKIGHTQDPHGPTQDPTRESEATDHILVEDCRFTDGGHIALGPAAVWIGLSGHNRVRHCEISGQFQWAISVGFVWAYFPLTRARDNHIEFNHVHHLGTGILGTHGALYCVGAQPGTVFRNNYIHHVFSNPHWGAGEGIILDNGCSGILVENNLIHDAAAGGWGCNFNCFGNIIQNNIFAYGEKYQLTRYGDAPEGQPPPNGEVFARNIVLWKEGPLFKEKNWHAFATLWDYNLYWCESAEVRMMEHSFSEWQAKGLDRHSVAADPGFVDAAARNFRLSPDSPAWRLGFQALDMSAVGPRGPIGPGTANASATRCAKEDQNDIKGKVSDGTEGAAAMKTVRDCLWIWGHEAGSHNAAYELPGHSRMTPVEGAFYLGVPNLIMVVCGNRPEPPFDRDAVAMRPLDRIVWSIVGDSSSKRNDTQSDIEEVIRLAERFPNITGAIMDDFFTVKGSQRDPEGRYPVKELLAFRDRLHAQSKPLDLWVVLYGHQLGWPVRQYLDACDVVAFWTWQAKSLLDLEANVEALEKLAPAKRKVLGCYLWDYGDEKPMPLASMQRQCEQGLAWLKDGRIEGMIFLASCISDLELETVEWTRDWIQRVGKTPLQRNGPHG